MRLLLDTHVALWSLGESSKLSQLALGLILDPSNQVFFSVVSLWEVSIKRSLRRSGFSYAAATVRRVLMENQYSELLLTADHVIALDTLPRLHKDPFDRILIAQSVAEGMTFLTADQTVAQYPGLIQRV